MNFTFIDNFPEGFEPNESQNQILTELGQALEDGKRFIIINAPTATGKSFISKTVANFSKEAPKNFIEAANSYALFQPKFELEYESFGTAVLTVTKNLQNQYISMFPDGKCLKGCGNYECSVDISKGCEVGPCKVYKTIFENCLKTDSCPYWNAMREAVKSKCAFYNYSMFNSLKPVTKHKQFIICDEASELEETLVGSYTFEFVFKTLKKILSDNDKQIPPTPKWNDSEEVYYKWACKMAGIMEHIYDSYMNHLSKIKKNGKKLTKPEVEKIKLYEEPFLNFKALIENWAHTKYIVTRNDSSIIFQPYNIDRIAHEHLFKYGETIILMSATIVDPGAFAKSLGIKDYAYIEAPSPLPPEKAPIHFTQKYYLSYNNINKLIPFLTPFIEELCKKHKGQKGIIHTHSMQILNLFKNNVKDSSRFLFRQPGMNNEQLLEEHSRRLDDTILVSPSMTHGIDLKGNLGEFQIILKAPYLPLNDKRVAKKKDEDSEWYVNRMLSTLIQMSGRCNRCVEDYSETYILDGCITSAVLNNMNKLPKYFKDRII